jgi:hypothetical protein
MTTFLFVTDEGYEPEGVGKKSAYWWSCSKTAGPGDVALVYVVGRGIAHEWDIVSEPRTDPDWRFVCNVRHRRSFDPPITIREITSAVARDEWGAPYTNFRGFRSIRIPDGALKKLAPMLDQQVIRNR